MYGEIYIMLDPKKLRERRLRKNWTQADLAKLAGLTREAIARLESEPDCDPKISTVEGIASALGCGIAMILSPGGAAERRAAIDSMEVLARAKRA